MSVQEFTPEELESEEWRDIPDYQGIYQASSIGRIKRIKPHQARRETPYCIKACQSPSGYLFVLLCKNGVRVNHRVHMLVAAAFLGPRPFGLQINHMDGHKQNNAPTNLEYVTPQANIDHAVRLGLKRSRIGPNPNLQGENCPGAKITSKDVIDIRRAILSGAVGNDLAKQYGLSPMAISLIKTGKAWKYLSEGRDEVCALGPGKTLHRTPRGRNPRPKN